MANQRRPSSQTTGPLESDRPGGAGAAEETLRPDPYEAGPGSAALWRAVWTAIFVVLAGALNTLLADPDFVTRFLAGDYSVQFIRFAFVTAIVGALAAVKRYYNLKLPPSS